MFSNQDSTALERSIIENHDGELLVSSEIVAERTEKDHASILRTLDEHSDSFAAFGQVRFEIRPGYNNAPVRFALLNEHQATLLVTFMRNIGPVKAFKVELVKQFYAMRQALAQPTLPSARQLALMVIEAEDAREAAAQRAVAAEARADATQLIIDNVERKDGLVVRAWLKKYFPPRQEHRLWDLFYSRNLLKDGRGQGGTDRRGKPKASRDHQSVYTEGQAFFIRTEKDYQVGDGVTRYETRVRPGRAELELVAYCQRAGIEPLPEVAEALVEIQDLSAIFNTQKELAA